MSRDDRTARGEHGLVPDYTLERVLAGELARDAVPPSQASRLAALEEDTRRFLERDPPHLAAARLRARAEQESRVEQRGFRRGIALAAPALAAGLAIVVFSMPSAPPVDVDVSAAATDRAKGAALLSAYRLVGNEVVRVAAGERLAAGDVVQLSLLASAPHGVVLSIDGRGSVTLHHPSEPKASTRLPEDGRLPDAFELDDAPGFERFFLVTSETPLDVGTLLQQAEALGSDPVRAREAPLPLPAELSQASLLVEKKTP